MTWSWFRLSGCYAKKVHIASLHYSRKYVNQKANQMIWLMSKEKPVSNPLPPKPGLLCNLCYLLTPVSSRFQLKSYADNCQVANVIDNRVNEQREVERSRVIMIMNNKIKWKKVLWKQSIKHAWHRGKASRGLTIPAFARITFDQQAFEIFPAYPCNVTQLSDNTSSSKTLKQNKSMMSEKLKRQTILFMQTRQFLFVILNRCLH